MGFIEVGFCAKAVTGWNQIELAFEKDGAVCDGMSALQGEGRRCEEAETTVA